MTKFHCCPFYDLIFVTAMEKKSARAKSIWVARGRRRRGKKTCVLMPRDSHMLEMLVGLTKHIYRLVFNIYMTKQTKNYNYNFLMNYSFACLTIEDDLLTFAGWKWIYDNVGSGIIITHFYLEIQRKFRASEQHWTVLKRGCSQWIEWFRWVESLF